MPSSQLPRASYDEWVYDFSCIVGGYGLRPMCSHCARASCDFYFGHSATGRYKAIRRLLQYGYCTEVVQCPCCCRAVPAAFAGKSYGASAASAQRLRGDRMVNVRLSCVCVFFTISARPRRSPHAGIVRCYLQRLRATGFRFFKLVINSLNKMVKSTAPVSPYGPRLPPLASVRRPHGKADKGRIWALKTHFM